MNKLKAIEVFINVADTGSFAAAARKLSISPPSVTRIIKELEDDLDILLIKRTTRVFTLTNTGRKFYQDCKNLIDKLHTAEAEAKSRYKTPVGHLKITAPAMFGALFVTPVLTEFLTLYPKMTVSTHFSDNITDILEEDIDIAIRIGELVDSTLMAKKIASVSRIISGSPDYLKERGTPKSIPDLNNHNLVSLKTGDGYYHWRFKGRENIDQPKTLTVNSVLAGKTAAVSGWGLTQTLSYQVIPEIENGSLVPILSEYTPARLPIYIIHSEGRQASAKISEFSKLISKRFKSNPHLNP